MDQTEIQRFAEQWIAYQLTQRPGAQNAEGRDAPGFAVVIRMMEIVADDRPAAVAICAEIARQSGDPWILEILGAGSLEDLLADNGEDVLQDYLVHAKDNPNFRQALHHVWHQSGRPAVWEQFIGIRDKLALPRLPRRTD